ncbi:FAD-dependent oxidoreductase [Brevibacillus brevis]|uniref:FAD-dependent oxidoreductase n=1 Tax=Brevibacillus brevis TaxID=1393 RepID=UPI000E396B02|nr:FAD-dependent oxidoreductase [Brevibacillus brevis]RED35628.1 hypothetical protein DES34_101287 [Brevibacillus brevis]GEC87697.1 hypothetical protein BBR01nite_00280 [Brevibacillus brevis]VEF89261.1 Uncharacterised protein [Brevibacillus brevis]
MMKNKKIVVVGASMTFYLSKQNQNVTLLETNSTAACEATNKSFAWIHPTGQIGAVPPITIE